MNYALNANPTKNVQVPADSLPHWKLMSKSPCNVRGTYKGKCKQKIYDYFNFNSNKHLLEPPAAMDPKPGERQSNGRQECKLQGMQWELQMQQQERLVEASRRTLPATGTNNIKTRCIKTGLPCNLVNIASVVRV